jgi:hypothetical protein
MRSIKLILLLPFGDSETMISSVDMSIANRKLVLISADLGCRYGLMQMASAIGVCGFIFTACPFLGSAGALAG